jgi:putative ABC transport system substrate-binding protein
MDGGRGEKTMKRFIVVFALALAVLASVQPAWAQKGKVYRIGYLSGRSAAQEKRLLPAFLEGLRELGYVEGKNIIIERRMTGGRKDRLRALAEELVRLKVEVIVSSSGVRTARRVTKTIPIVFTASADPVGTGVVTSLARPGGNITGLTDSHSDLIGKRLEILKEVVPSASRVAVLWNPAARIHPAQWKQIQTAAPGLGVTLLSLEVRNSEEFDRALAVMRKERPGGLVVFGHSSIAKYRKRILEFSLKNRLPVIYTQSGWVAAGGLMSYGADFLQLWRRAATYVDKILKGTKPADIPLERARKFDLTINLKTAKAIGLTIPPEVLFRATRVIR